MKIIFVESEKKFNKLELLEKNLKKILKNIDTRKDISIFYTIQYRKPAEQIKDFLKNHTNNKIYFKQILGCSKIKKESKDSEIIFIGDGSFHFAPFLRAGIKKINILTFPNNKISIKKIRLNIEGYEKEKKSKIIKFLHSEKVGVLISTKLGQYKLNTALKLAKSLKSIGKKSYILICDSLNICELENFPFQIYINTACPGLEFDNKKIINYKDVLKFLNTRFKTNKIRSGTRINMQNKI